MSILFASNAACCTGKPEQAQERHLQLRAPSGGQSRRNQSSTQCRSLGTLMQHRTWMVTGATGWQSLVTQGATCCAGHGGMRSSREGTSSAWQCCQELADLFQHVCHAAHCTGQHGLCCSAYSRESHGRRQVVEGQGLVTSTAGQQSDAQREWRERERKSYWTLCQALCARRAELGTHGLKHLPGACAGGHELQPWCQDTAPQSLTPHLRGQQSWVPGPQAVLGWQVAACQQWQLW